MNVRLPVFLSATAIVCVVAIVPYATVWMPFQPSLWAGGAALVAIVAALVLLGRRELLWAVADAPRIVRLGLGLYLASAAYGTLVGLALGNPLRYVVTQAASMAILPASFVGFRAGMRPSLRKLAAGLGLGSFAALTVHAAFLVARAGAPAVSGEALRLVLPNDVAFTGTAVMALLGALAWRSETRAPLATAACLASGCLLVGSMSRGAWLAGLGGVALSWWLSRRRRWWTLAIIAAAPLICVAGLIAASAWAWNTARPLVESSIDVAADTPPETMIDIQQQVPVSGGPVEIAFSVNECSIPPQVFLVWAWNPVEEPREVADILPNLRAPSQVVRQVLFPPAGATQMDFCEWEPAGSGHSIRFEARELRGALAGWVRTFGLRLSTLGTAITNPSRDGTMEYRVREWEAVRKVWAGSSPLRRVTGHGLGAIVEFPNSSWDSGGRRILAPTTSYLHNFYVFLGFKLGFGGIVALAGLLMIAGWTWRAARRARDEGGSPMLAAAAACWCAYLAWSTTSPEIINAHTATLLGALLASSLSDAALKGAGPPQDASRIQSSSISNA